MRRSRYWLRVGLVWVTAITAWLATHTVIADANAIGIDARQPDWRGHYVGFMYARGIGQSSVDLGSTDDTYRVDGDHGGLLLGHSWLIDRWLVGLEANIHIQEIKGRRHHDGSSSRQHEDYTWAAAAKTRFGYTAKPALADVHLGLLVGERHIFDADSNRGAVASALGWTGGAGIEFALPAGWISRLEYVYQHLPQRRYHLDASEHPVDNRLNVHFLRAALIFPESAHRSRASRAGEYNLYAGLLGGYSRAREHFRTPTTETTTVLTGGHGGIVMGYGKTLNGLYLGLEGDLQILDIAGSTSASVAHTSRLFYSASARVRLGYAFPNLLPYTSLGYAISQVEYTTPDNMANVDPLKRGVAYGAGIDWRIGGKHRLRTEYLHYDHIAIDVEQVPGPAEASYEVDALRIGIVRVF